MATLIDRAHWASLADAHAEAPERVWGVAYRIRADRVAEVKEYLDIREINGYTIHYAPFYPASVFSSAAATADQTGTGAEAEPGTIRTLVYIGTPENPQFVGPQDPDALAAHIAASVGPSGPNRDYLLELESALDDLGPGSGDAHVRDLADRLRALEVAKKGAGEEGSGPEREQEEVPHEFSKVDSVDEQEETEKT